MAYNKYEDAKPKDFNAKRTERDKVGNMGTSQLPNGYLNRPYNTDDGKCDTRYVGRYAMEIAKQFSMDRETGKSKIRAYFDEVISIQSDLKYKHITEDEAMKKIIKLKSRVANRMSKKTASVLFGQFIGKNVDTVTADEKDFVRRLGEFADHFEAVVGFTEDKK